LLALADALIRANGGGTFEHREFPAERKAIDIGDFVSDDRRFRALTGWAPRTGLDDGLASSLDYYRRHLASYV
jgi:UDP-glucose 4-epimerase